MLSLLWRDRALRWLLLCVLFVIALSWIAYFAVGRTLIADLYYGRVESIFGERLEASAQTPLDFYYRRAENMLMTASLLFVIGVLYMFLVIRHRRGIAEVARRERRWSVSATSQSFREKPINRARWLVMLALLAGFFLLYLWQGAQFLTSPAISEDSLLFEADVLIAVDDMTKFRAEQYVLPPRHPLFVLMVNPVGSLLSRVLPPLTAALVLNSLFGALGVVLAFLVFDRWRRSLLFAAALAVLFGCTMSQLFSTSLPETYALAACTLLVTYLLTIISVQQKRVDFWPWVIAGVLAMGVIATNVVQTVICFAFAVRASRHRVSRPLLPKVLTFTLAIGIIVIVLCLVQKIIYPAVTIFSAGHQRVTLGFVDFSPLLHPLDLLARELKHFVLANFVGAIPQTIPWPGTTLPALTYDAPLQFTTVGWIAAGLWMIVFVAGMVSALRYQGENKIVLKALSACVIFSYLLHTFYATGVTGRAEFFLYSAHWTFAVLFLVTAGCLKRSRMILLAVGILAVFLLMNNLDMMQYFLEIYESR